MPSDTIGLTRDSVLKTWHLSKEAIQYPSVLQVLNLFLKSQIPDDHFHWSTVTVNTDYCAPRDRDKNNWGPSATTPFGNFTGGQLVVWPEERDGKVLAYATNKSVVYFDGHLRHEVAGYAGTRVSIVW